jgi:hypothetical protein
MTPTRIHTRRARAAYSMVRITPRSDTVRTTAWRWGASLGARPLSTGNAYAWALWGVTCEPNTLLDAK